MARDGSGVTVRGESIQVAFTVDGKAIRKTLMLAGKRMAPTTPNLKFAARLVAEIREKIRNVPCGSNLRSL